MNIYGFLPVESTPRELDYKLNLARLFCRSGFKVMLGYPPFIRDELKYKNYKGFFLEKGANPTPEYYANLKKKGIFLYDLSDEGAAKPVYSVTYQPAVDALQCMRKIFLWGESQKHELINLNDDKNLAQKYEVIGSPAFDLSCPKYRSFHINLKPKQLPEQYILINTNFGMLNGYDIEEQIIACSNMSPETYQNMLSCYESDKKQFAVFKDWLEELFVSFPEENFIIRPHPSEIAEKYINLFSSFTNVTVSKSGNVNQVISSAKMVLHKDCTTALQGYLMGLPVFSLGGPDLNSQYVQWSLAFGKSPSSVAELKTMMRNVMKNNNHWDEQDLAEINVTAANTLANTFANIGESSSRLVDVITNDVANSYSGDYNLIDSRSWLQKIKKIIRSYLPLHYKVPLAERETLKVFDKRDVAMRLELLERIDPSGMKFNIKKIYHNTYIIEGKS